MFGSLLSAHWSLARFAASSSAFTWLAARFVLTMKQSFLRLSFHPSLLYFQPSGLKRSNLMWMCHPSTAVTVPLRPVCQCWTMSPTSCTSCIANNSAASWSHIWDIAAACATLASTERLMSFWAAGVWCMYACYIYIYIYILNTCTCMYYVYMYIYIYIYIYVYMLRQLPQAMDQQFVDHFQCIKQ